ncbi:hypothetical protein [Staphylococcus cohnii]|uniref:hypothetical protein n=1 Tax=Staphylococcus cohnii TaxID=29382 RepID=UPI003D7DA54E
MRTIIVEEDKLLSESFDEQINKVIEEIDEIRITIRDIKVLSEHKVLIIYTINKFI